MTASPAARLGGSGWMQITTSTPMTAGLIDGFLREVAEVLAEEDEHVGAEEATAQVARL